MCVIWKKTLFSTLILGSVFLSDYVVFYEYSFLRTIEVNDFYHTYLRRRRHLASTKLQIFIVQCWPTGHGHIGQTENLLIVQRLIYRQNRKNRKRSLTKVATCNDLTSGCTLIVPQTLVYVTWLVVM